MLVTCFIVLLLSSLSATQNPDEFCQRTDKVINKIFRLSDSVIIGLQGDTHLYGLKIGTKYPIHTYNVDELCKQLTDIRCGIHFDIENPCVAAQSNPSFCRMSKITKDLVVLFGTKNNGTATVKKIALERFRQNHLEDLGKYEKTEFKTDIYHPANLTFTYYNQHDDLMRFIKSDSSETRLFQTLWIYFVQFLENSFLDFIGGTYDRFTDSLYVLVRVKNKADAANRAWGVGEYGMFRANFSPMGMIQDSYHVMKFDHEVAGIFHHFGHLYVLHGDGKTFIQIFEDKKTGNSFSLEELFCSKDSPLRDPKKGYIVPIRIERHEKYEDTQLVPNIAQFLFPRYPERIQVIAPELLEGSNFFFLITFLALIFVFMAGLNIFTLHHVQIKEIMAKKKLKKLKKLSRRRRSGKKTKTRVRSRVRSRLRSKTRTSSASSGTSQSKTDMKVPSETLGASKTETEAGTTVVSKTGSSKMQ